MSTWVIHTRHLIQFQSASFDIGNRRSPVIGNVRAARSQSRVASLRSARRISRLGSQLVQGKIQLQNIHARRAEKTDVGGIGVRADQFANFCFGEVAGFRHARRLEFRVAQADVWIKSAAGGGDGIGRSGRVGSEAVLRSVVGNVLRDGVAQLLRSRAEVAAAGIRGVVAVARGRWARVEILVGGELLAKQPRAAHRSVRVHDQAAVGFGGEKHLCDAEHHQRIQPATDDGENQRGCDCAAKFEEMLFHKFRQV